MSVDRDDEGTREKAMEAKIEADVTKALEKQIPGLVSKIAKKPDQRNPDRDVGEVSWIINSNSPIQG